VTTVIVLMAVPAVAQAVGVGVRLSNSTVAEWVAPYEAGNAVGLSGTLDIGDFQGCISAGLVLPDSRPDAQFTVFSLEAQWHPFRRSEWANRLHLSPYVVGGIGVAGEDQPPSDTEVSLVRWVTEGPQFLGQLGLGFTFGASTGLYVSVDIRAYNHTHGGVLVGAGFRW